MSPRPKAKFTPFKICKFWKKKFGVEFFLLLLLSGSWRYSFVENSVLRVRYLVIRFFRFSKKICYHNSVFYKIFSNCGLVYLRQGFYFVFSTAHSAPNLVFFGAINAELLSNFVHACSVRAFNEFVLTWSLRP